MDIYWPTFFFYLFGFVACAFAVAVVVSANIVRMAFYLVMSLAGTAGLFFVAGADFVGAMQFMIYVGGTLVLVVFGVMLTAQGPFIVMKSSPAEWAIATLVGLLFLGGTAAVVQTMQDGLFVAWSKLGSPLIDVADLRNPLPAEVFAFAGMSQQQLGVAVGWTVAVAVYLVLAYMTFLYRWPQDDRRRLGGIGGGTAG